MNRQMRTVIDGKCIQNMGEGGGIDNDGGGMRKLYGCMREREGAMGGRDGSKYFIDDTGCVEELCMVDKGIG